MKKLLIVLFLVTAQVFATVSDGETVRQAFQSDGVNTTYTFTFSCNSSDDVFVYAPLTATGDPTAALTVDIDYTIAPTGGSYLNGGVVTISPALASTFTVKIVRRIKQSQGTSSGAVTPTSIVAALDKLTRMLQDAEDRKNRSLHIPDSDATSFNMEIPNSVDRASKFLGFDTVGNVTLFDSTGSGSGVTHSSFGTSFAITATASSARTLLELSTSDDVEFATIAGTTGAFSGLITANGGVTLGAAVDLIGSATSDITFNTNKFTVAGATGNTVIAGTLDITDNIDPTSYETTNGGFLNSDTMAGAADTSTASSDSIVKYTTLDADGVLMHDAEGAFNNCDIDGTKTKVYTKYFTGTTAAGVTTTKAHGIAGIDNILSVSSSIFSTANSIYRVYSAGDGTGDSATYLLSYDGTNIELSTVGVNLQSQKYRIKIDYVL